MADKLLTGQYGENLQKKTDRVNIDEVAIHCAVEDVVNGILSIRKAAEKYNLKPATLQHRIEKRKLTGKTLNSAVYSSKFSSQQVFTKEQEKLLSEYIITCSKMHYSLTLRHLQSLAYEYAKKLNCKYPSSWDTAKVAGIDWTQG
ncbi:helix-turn-helix psq domain [Holotrichia oblita]|uniref:Helix-turn-helix psq domain n=1 Tax=Holotrichia oblita TaxID=644536 RepID=A0ACB9TAY5_HOLOL|nr:helix-turn-helix psq domain [Holotrichia oblita]